MNRIFLLSSCNIFLDFIVSKLHYFMHFECLDFVQNNNKIHSKKIKCINIALTYK